MPSDNFPPELIHAIFKYGARQSRHFCATLSLVSSWTRDLAYPILYHTIVLQNSTDIVDLHRRLHEPHQRFAPFVHNVYIPDNFLNGQRPHGVRPVSLLLSLPNLQCIAVTCLYWLELLITSPLASPLPNEVDRPQGIRISILPDDEHRRSSSLWFSFTCGGTEIHPFWGSVTHIHFSLPLPAEFTRKILLLRRLTHLAMPLLAHEVEGPASLERLLAHPSLRMILIIFLDGKLDAAHKQLGLNWFWNRRRTDGRMYLLETSPCDVLTQWANEEDGGPDIWAKGEKFTLDSIGAQSAAGAL